MEIFEEKRPPAATRNKAGEKTRAVEVNLTIAAAPEAVFLAWSDPDLVKQWWGPDGFVCPFARLEFRVGGQYLFEMRSDSGEDIWSTGTFEAIEPDRRIVMTSALSNENGDVLPAAGNGVDGPFPDDGAGTITVALREHEDGETGLSLRHDGLAERMHDGCVRGWSSSLEKLKRAVERH